MTLDELRDKLISESDCQRKDFLAGLNQGWSAALKALAEQVEEFDADAIVVDDECNEFDFVEGARWQFEQCKLQIEIWAARVKDYEIRSTILEARLAESERALEVWKMSVPSYDEIQNKLAQAEARIKELEAIADACLYVGSFNCDQQLGLQALAEKYFKERE